MRKSRRLTNFLYAQENVTNIMIKILGLLITVLQKVSKICHKYLNTLFQCEVTLFILSKIKRSSKRTLLLTKLYTLFDFEHASKLLLHHWTTKVEAEFSASDERNRMRVLSAAFPWAKFYSFIWKEKQYKTKQKQKQNTEIILKLL